MLFKMFTTLALKRHAKNTHLATKYQLNNDKATERAKPPQTIPRTKSSIKSIHHPSSTYDLYTLQFGSFILETLNHNLNSINPLYHALPVQHNYMRRLAIVGEMNIKESLTIVTKIR